MAAQEKPILAAEVVMPCEALEPNRAFFVDRLGFVVMSIYPADCPTTAVLRGHGLALRLVQTDATPAAAPLTLSLTVEDPAAFLGSSPTPLTAPNGTVVEVVAANPPVVIPALVEKLEVCRGADEQEWISGRAGMLYRDLIGSRLGGRFIASHIQIPEGGPVPDYVHFHRVRFQLIFCYRGWVKVVYEDQGEPFVLEAGDMVLQPPTIRHRVLESSAGLEVIELGCPAEHITMHDPELPLPTGKVDPDRLFGGQLFTRHIASTTPWEDAPNCKRRDLGLWPATKELATGAVVRHTPDTGKRTIDHKGEFFFSFVLDGACEVCIGDAPAQAFKTGDSYVVPSGTSWTITPKAELTDILEIVLPEPLPAA